MYKLLISKVLRYGPCVTRGSHSFTCHPHTNHTCHVFVLHIMTALRLGNIPTYLYLIADLQMLVLWRREHVHGLTPLMEASAAGHAITVQFFLQHVSIVKNCYKCCVLGQRSRGHKVLHVSERNVDSLNTNLASILLLFVEQLRGLMNNSICLLAFIFDFQFFCYSMQLASCLNYAWKLAYWGIDACGCVLLVRG